MRPPEVVAAERRRVAHEGWGGQLLTAQASEGYWGGPGDIGPWMTTIGTLELLKDFGVDPKNDRASRAIDRVKSQLTWDRLDGRPFFDGEVEPCINGAILEVGSYFGVKCDRLVKTLLGEQLDDGGWNCDAPSSQRSSFHTTIRVLEGLLECEKSFGPSAAVGQARKRGETYLLDRRLFRSKRTGEVIDRHWLNYAYPPTWHYDILRGLDYFRNAQVKPDEGMDEAVAQMLSRMHQNGRWPLHVQHDDSIPFEMESGVGSASRWNTLRALRVLAWYLGES